MRKLFSMILVVLLANSLTAIADFDGAYDWGFDEVIIPDTEDPDFDEETDFPHFLQWSTSAGSVSSNVNPNDGIMGMYESFGEPYNGVSFNEGGIGFQIANAGVSQSQYDNRGYMAISTINSFILPDSATGNRYEFGLNMDWYSGVSESDHLYLLIYKDNLAKPVDFIGTLNDYLYSEIISSTDNFNYAQVWTNESGSYYLNDGADLGWGTFGAEDVSYYRSAFTFEEDVNYKMTIMMTFDGYSLNSAGEVNPYSTIGIDEVLYREASAVPAPGAVLLASAGTLLAGRFRRR